MAEDTSPRWLPGRFWTSPASARVPDADVDAGPRASSPETQAPATTDEPALTQSADPSSAAQDEDASQSADIGSESVAATEPPDVQPDGTEDAVADAVSMTIALSDQDVHATQTQSDSPRSSDELSADGVATDAEEAEDAATESDESTAVAESTTVEKEEAAASTSTGTGTVVSSDSASDSSSSDSSAVVDVGDSTEEALTTAAPEASTDAVSSTDTTATSTADAAVKASALPDKPVMHAEDAGGPTAAVGVGGFEPTAEPEPTEAVIDVVEELVLTETFSDGAEEGEYERLEEESTHEAPTRATGGTRPPVRRLTKRAKQYNYASYDCNAKVLDSNKGSQRVRSILSDDMDKYALNLCKANIFYVVQLCDDIRIVSLQLSNQEYFSSTFRNFSVWVGEQYPTNQWHFLASFEAANDKRPQTFVVDREDDWYRGNYFKYVKIEILSHWDAEHFCPLTQLKVQGMTMYEDWMAENSLTPDDEEAENPPVDDDGPWLGAPSLLRSVQCVGQAWLRREWGLQCFESGDAGRARPPTATVLDSGRATERVPPIPTPTTIAAAHAGRTFAPPVASPAATAPPRETVRATPMSRTEPWRPPPVYDFVDSRPRAHPHIRPSAAQCPLPTSQWPTQHSPRSRPRNVSIVLPSRDQPPPLLTPMSLPAVRPRFEERSYAWFVDDLVPPPPRLPEGDEQEKNIYSKFDKKIRQLEAYADSNSKYLEDLHARYVSPHTSMQAELILQLRDQQAAFYGAILPQLDDIRAAVGAIRDELAVTKAKVDAVESWTVWAISICFYGIVLYMVWRLCVAAVNTVSGVLKGRSGPSEFKLRRSVSTANMPPVTAPPRNLPHKSMIQSLDLPDPRSRAAPVESAHQTARLRMPSPSFYRATTPDEGIDSAPENNLTYPLMRKGPKKRKKSRPSKKG